jgi:hypothetical protein
MFNMPGAAGRPEPAREESAEPAAEEAAGSTALQSDPDGEDAAEIENEGAEAKPAPEKKPAEGIESDPYEWGVR